MKMKQPIILLAMIFVFGTAMAQDIIHTTDGQNIKARSIKFEGNSIRYSLYEASIMDRSTYLMDISRVNMIIYDDGHIFDPTAKSEPAAKQTAQTPRQQQVQTKDSHDTVFVYANVQPNKQLNSRLFNAYPQYKNSATAFVHSLVLPGLGQMYNDEVDKGLYFMGGDIVILGATVIAYANENYTVAIIGLAGSLVLRAASAISAAERAQEINHRNGYVYITPTLQQSSFTFSDGATQLVPGISMSFAF